MTVGSSAIPNLGFLRELQDNDRRNGFVVDHLRTRIALLIRTLREQRGWSQAELGRRLDKPQSVVSRLEDPDYGKVTLKTLFEVAVAFDLPLYIDMPDWDEWFRLMSDMSSRNLRRDSFDAINLVAIANQQQAAVQNIAIAQGSGILTWGTGWQSTGPVGLIGNTYSLANTGNVLIGGNMLSQATPPITVGVSGIDITTTASNASSRASRADNTVTVNAGSSARTLVIAPNQFNLESRAMASGD
jgi:transcriptional regulator with XRE-family HTH domain